MTEKAGGSDVGAIETEAERNGVGTDGVERWRLYGEKWFCSTPMPMSPCCSPGREARAPGTRGLGLFALPRRLEDGIAQQLPDRAAEGQARHPLDGLGRDHAWTARSPIWSGGSTRASSR